MIKPAGNTPSILYSQEVPSPCYVCEEAKLQANLELMQRVQQESGASIILALKGFSMWSTFGLAVSYTHLRAHETV